MSTLHSIRRGDAALVLFASGGPRLELGGVDADLGDAEVLEVARQRLELAPGARLPSRSRQRLTGTPVVDDDAPASDGAYHLGAYLRASVHQAAQGAVVDGLARCLHVGDLGKQYLGLRWAFYKRSHCDILVAASAGSVGCSDHQANPQVHPSVKPSSMPGERLSPRKADLHHWRETFAEKLRGCGIEAEASRQATRGVTRNADALWRLNAGSEGRLQTQKKGDKSGRPAMLSRSEAIKTWGRLAYALASSDLADHHRLAAEIHSFIHRQPAVQEALKRRQRRQTLEQARRQTQQPAPQCDAAPPRQGRPGPDLVR